VRVRRLEARRKADRIVTERYHRGSSEAETAARPQVRIAGALFSHDSGNLRHRLSEHGGCDAATEATESGPLNRSGPVRLVAPCASLRHSRRCSHSTSRHTRLQTDQGDNRGTSSQTHAAKSSFRNESRHMKM